ncbi:ComF family protein [Hyphomicrobium sp.]|uniref:ComF family protein n=1 Tax=Hyphomicrobium sp. TaxID=82 RepID=UPI0025BA5E21|nr:ComF family protein [Hyphomicrobium sp.]MCC7251384.1 ComF family protein [Hyphomicrobium sp.]
MVERGADDGARSEDGPTAPGLFRRAFRALSDIVMPPVCLVCRTPVGAHDALCAHCWCDIDFIRPPLCDRLGIPLPFDTGGTMISAAAAADPPPYDRARAVAAHAGAMRTLVHALKFHDRHDVRRLLGKWLVEAGREMVAETDVVVPVPLARWRLLVRRFNQAAILASEVARLTGLGYEPLLLARTRSTSSQVGLSRGERRRNVAGAFAVPPRLEARVRGQRILLIDDVITTGSTVGACARALRRAGAARVDVLALALVTDRALIPS